MKNIDYLELFFKKHKLSGKVTVNYSTSVPVDDYMTDIIFENGDVISISDVIFDIDSDFPDDVFDQWMVVKRENDISLMDWIQTNTHYIPKDLDRSSVEEYQKELEDIVDNVTENINTLFKLQPDDGDSEEDTEKGEDE
jgi:hypothetical protein